MLAALVVSTADGSARSKPHLAPLWATINICDTPSHPDAVGVRGRMSARSRRTRMYMRFSLQYYDVERGRFVRVRDTLSPLVYVGRGLRRGRQGGFTFELDAPETSYLIRGRAEFFWYRRKRRPGTRRSRLVLVKQAKRITRGGKKHVRGGDPPGYSAGTCDLR
jgi:hypothetical protein